MRYRSPVYKLRIGMPVTGLPVGTGFWRAIDNFMSAVGGMRCMTAEKWAEIFLTGDFEMFVQDDRGGKQGESFFDVPPELEIPAKLYVAEASSQKSTVFKALDVSNYIDSQYYELTNTNKSNNELIRSERMCRLDMRRWECKFESNTQRPYFQGHDRADVLAYRKEFLSYFLSRKNNYYLVNIGDQPIWSIPTQQPRILICKFEYQIHKAFCNMSPAFPRCLCHVDSTFRSGEVFAKRWIYDDNHTATATISSGTNLYFKNDTILSQFERLFRMLEFKTEYKNHHIDIFVGNARTHTARQYSIHDFGKNINTRCPVDHIEFSDKNGVKQSRHCYIESGPNKNK
ncbi:unnamed protein product, partial [Didymodactylos carnosus]